MDPRLHPWFRAGLALLACSLAAARADGTHICFEKVSDIPSMMLQEHPVGNALAVGSQDGVIRLLVRPRVRSGTQASNFSVFLDLSARVHFEGQAGLLSFAFHPNFAANGRFFVSYVCDATKHPDCQGPCACSPRNNCTGAPAQCPLNTVVAEYSAGPNATQAITLNATEVRKVFHFGRLSRANFGGHIWFASDGLLYFASGDGSIPGAPPGPAAQNGLSPLGKILRFDVDKDTPGNATLYGDYAVPATNPFVFNASSIMPEVYAVGFRNPWRCSYDAPTKTTLCGDIGPSAIQEVYLVDRGANYGWPFMYGTSTFMAQRPVGPTPLGTSFAPPLYQYNGAAVIGGYVYRANRNPCLQGRYIFGDEGGSLLLSSPFGTVASFENATFSVAPQPSWPTTNDQGMVVSDPFPAGDGLYSWGVDSAGELYRLSSSGIYRVIEGEICGATCGNSNVYGAPPPETGKHRRKGAAARISQPGGSVFWVVSFAVAFLGAMVL